jgi:hypothetical protein
MAGIGSPPHILHIDSAMSAAHERRATAKHPVEAVILSSL